MNEFVLIQFFFLLFRNELEVARQENEELRLRLSKYENIANLNLK